MSTDVRNARNAAFAVFAASGAIFASFASRLPDIKGQLGMSAGELGLTLLVGSFGALLGMPFAGRLAQRIGADTTIRLAAAVLLVGYGLVALAVGPLPGRLLLGIGLFVGSLGIGTWDVAMNLHGAVVEKRLGRTVMPWFHAAFSGGTVVGALLGSLAAGVRLAPGLHIFGATVLGSVLAAWAVRHFLPARDEAAEHGTPAPGARTASAWTDPKTLLIGVMVFVGALTEGTANDWVAVALHEGYHLPTWAGVLGFALFLSAMTAGRIIGAGMVDRYGRVPVLRTLFVAAAIGCGLVVFGGPVLAFVGAAVWGVGASLGFPMGMSAAADDPRRAAARMSVVSTIGYLAFLSGPPALGLLGDHVGVLRSLLVVGVAAVVALFVVPAAREPRRPRPLSDERDGRECVGVAG